MDKRKSIRDVIPKKHKIILGKYYLTYSVKEKTEQVPMYEITARYFIYTGNILADSKDLRTEKFLFRADVVVKSMVSNIKKSINNTRKEMYKELKRIDASP